MNMKRVIWVGLIVWCCGVCPLTILGDTLAKPDVVTEDHILSTWRTVEDRFVDLYIAIRLGKEKEAITHHHKRLNTQLIALKTTHQELTKKENAVIDTSIEEFTILSTELLNQYDVLRHMQRINYIAKIKKNLQVISGQMKPYKPLKTP